MEEKKQNRLSTNRKLAIGIDKPIAFFDLETTGLEISKARIVSISIIKLYPNGSKEARSTIIDPEIPIPKEASDIHGITNDTVKGKPKFKQLANGIREFIGNAYIAGFNNNNYDNAVLAEEFCRCGINFPSNVNHSIDVGTIFKKKEERTLTAALKFYCGQELGEDAHNSDNDTVATLEVFISQLERYPDLAQMSVQELSEYCKYDDRVDFAGKICRDENGDYIFNFGQHKGKKLKDEEKYAKWMLANDFTENTKIHVKKALGMIPDEKEQELNFD